MKLLLCASFSIFFGLFVGTINGFAIYGEFEEWNEVDDYDEDDSPERSNDEITVHMWNLELPEEVDDSDSERTKVQTVVQRDDCFAEALKDVFDFLKLTQLFDFLNYNRKEIHDKPNNVPSEDTTSKSSPSTVTPGQHAAAKNVSSTVTPETSKTTAKSKDTTSTSSSSSTVTAAPEGAEKNVSSTETPETATTSAESVNNAATTVPVGKNDTTA